MWTPSQQKWPSQRQQSLTQRNGSPWTCANKQNGMKTILDERRWFLLETSQYGWMNCRKTGKLSLFPDLENVAIRAEILCWMWDLALWVIWQEVWTMGSAKVYQLWLSLDLSSFSRFPPSVGNCVLLGTEPSFAKHWRNNSRGIVFLLRCVKNSFFWGIRDITFDIATIKVGFASRWARIFSNFS